MHIKEVRIRNFRSLKEVVVPLDKSTVIIGENSAGKSALVDAIKLVLSRRWGTRGTGFVEYDFHMDENCPDPKASPGIAIEILLEEEKSEDWPEALTQVLSNIVQTDPISGIKSVTLRAECKFNEIEKAQEASWQFLRRDGTPLSGQAKRSTNLTDFFDFLPIFTLSALRDASQEFSSRSQFFGNILKSVDIPDEKRAEIEASIESLNHELLHSDPKLATLRGTLSRMQDIVAQHAAGGIDVRALPLKIWDLLAKSEIVVRGRDVDPWLPLTRHGHGVQSLAVMYLFQAFVDHLLAETYNKLSEPVLALEEPEAHLHPQASRALWKTVDGLTGQKIITTHSPFFVENVPFRNVRILRKSALGTTVSFLPREFRAKIRLNDRIREFASNNADKYRLDAATQEIIAKGLITERDYRGLLTCFTEPNDKTTVHPALKSLMIQSVNYIDDGELTKLQTYARRIRGEIFFARCWLLCEGQSEFLLFHALGDALNFPLDKHGVSVIDYKNNGSAGSFSALARALNFPWLMMCDGDGGGSAHIEELKNRGFTSDELLARVTQLPHPNLEHCLIKGGLRDELVEILGGFVKFDPAKASDEQLITMMTQRKVEVANSLAGRMRTVPKLVEKVPKEITGMFEKVRACLA